MNISPGHRFHLKVALLIGFLVFIGFAFSGPVSEATEPANKAAAIVETKADKPIKVAQADKPKKKSRKKKVSTILDPTDPSSVLYLDTEGKLAGVGDPTKPASEAYKAGMAWHPQALAAEGLPKDRYGLVDWTRIVTEGILAPRHSLDPSKDEFPSLKMDIVMPVLGATINDVTFPHETHTFWLNCEVCHPVMFLPKKGENEVDMSGIAEGKWCGVCHGKVAFPLTDCNRCHNVPKKAAK